MKHKPPVTQVERFLQAGKPIVTKTDLEGRITYVNESFVQISGYTAEELIGANHHVVRHPDMPAPAFGDLWRTIGAGQPWRGLVKNRCKNGDHYWVEAYVTPITEQGRKTGYMSVRNAPSREEVRAAEALYAQINAGQAKMPPTPLRGAGLGFGGKVALGCAGTALAASLGTLPGLAPYWSLLAVPASAALAFWLHATVSVPLARAQAAMVRIEEGQLKERVDLAGAGALAGFLGELESMRIHLRAMFCDVLLSSKAVEASAARLDAEIVGLAGESDRQSEKVMEIAAAMEQMSVSINEINANTQLSLQTSESARDTVAASGARMSDGIERARQVIDVVRSSSDQIERLTGAVGRIDSVAAAIRAVAEKTNLLALNAAIEAARAGEQGRGFAVVADEVRRLAEQTAVSTTDITETVGGIGEVAIAANKTMKAAAQDVAASSNAIADMGEGLERIRSSTDAAVQAAREISDMLAQQSSASQSVAANMEEISSTIERNAHGIGEVQHTAHQLKATSEHLRQLIRHLEPALA